MISDLVIFTPMYVTLFWAVVLFTSKSNNNQAKHFLGIFMIAAFFLYLSHAVYFKKHNDIFLYFDPVYNFASLTVYPLYYWYIKLLTVDTRINFKNLQLLIPALFFGLATLLIYALMTPADRINYIDEFLFKEPINSSGSIWISVQKAVYICIRLTFAVQVVFFLIYGIRLVKKYNTQVANFYSNLENKTILWVNLLLVSFVLISLISIVFNVIGRAVFFESNYLLIIPSVVFSVLLFFIGLLGYKQNYTVSDLVNDEKQPEKDVKEFNKELLLQELILLFQKEKVFLKSDLKITQISRLLNTNRTYISNLINSEFSCSFSEFVNKYRLLEAKKLLTEKISKMYSLDYVCEKSGFGSLSTFIRVFRNSEGTTPGRFRNNQVLQKKEIKST